MSTPVLHLVCNAHLDPVWQWRWEEGAAEAVTTFSIAARLLREFPEFVFNHNEAILYRWVEDLDPRLFAEIRTLVKEGRWMITGGWDLQPDVNMPGTEALIRHIAHGRLYFREKFGTAPLVAYNFDSFGHTGGLPQLLAKTGYRMYVHMRPWAKDLKLPADLYRWRGVDGTEIAVYRMPFTAYNTWPGKAVERIMEAAEIALATGQDMPVFWGMGDHGGGAARAELEEIRALIQREKRVRIIHSSTETFYNAIQQHIAAAPVVEGDLQRVFTGCYTSMARLKRRMQRNLAELLQTEGARTATWWLRGQEYPGAQLEDAWRDHLFNDFHDILPGSSIEAAEHDALDLYGRSSETQRRIRLGTVSGFVQGDPLPIQIPITVLNTNPGGADLPVECEYMIDHMPRWEGAWQARLFTMDGVEIPVQEEAAEMLLLADQWRRKVSFSTPLPHVGAAHFHIEMHPGKAAPAPAPPALAHSINPSTGRIDAMSAGDVSRILNGELLRALVVDDDADSWGMERWNYKDVTGEFAPVPGSARTVEAGPVRTIREAVFTFGASSIILRTIAYAAYPFIEFRLRIVWNEERKRLKLSIPTRLASPAVVCEVPGGAISRPADGEEHSQGRWLMLDGLIDGRSVALGVVSSGQHGFDCHDGEVRLSVLRSAPYCFERTFATGPRCKVMDIGVHDVRILVTAGTPSEVRGRVPSLADWLAAPPYALAHYPIGHGTPSRQELLTLAPGSLRLLACKRSWDGNALIVRLQETTGQSTTGMLVVQSPSVEIAIACRPYEIRTYRIERDGKWREVAMIEEV
jgi:alpha-mannosidase